MIAPHMKADENLATRAKAAIRLGELFVRAGIVSQAAVTQALEISLAKGQQIGETLVAKGFINHSQLDAALSLQKMITAEQLSVGEATACLVKVFSTSKTVSQCLLELNLLKGQPASPKTAAKRRFDNDATVTQLPAFNTYKNKLAGNPFINFEPEKSSASVEVTSATAQVNSVAAAPLATEPAAQAASESVAGQIDNKLKAKVAKKTAAPQDEELSDLSLSEEEEIDYQAFFDKQFSYNSEDLKGFYRILRGAYSRLGRVLLKRQQLLEAEDLLNEAFDISLAHKLTDKQPEDIMFLACLYIKQGKSWQSEKLLKLYLGKLEKEEQPNDALLSLCHHRLALVYCHLSLLFKAEKHFKKAEEIIAASKQNQPSPRRLAAVLKDYAILLKRMKRESEADKYYSQARKILSSSLLTG
jgi:tetratricopeptide (TPR) repeat protein